MTILDSADSPSEQTVVQYFKERSRNGVLLLCVDKTGEPTAHIEYGSGQLLELVTKGGRWPVGDLGILGLWQIICWVEAKVSVIN